MKTSAGASAHTEYADQGDDQKVLMVARADCPVPASFTGWTDELAPEEKAKAAAAAKKGLPLENYMARGMFRCKNIKRCAYSSTDPLKREIHEKTCDEVLKKREAEWLAANPGKTLEEKLVEPEGDAGPEPLVVVEPPGLSKEDVVAIVKAEVAPMLSQILAALKKNENPKTLPGSAPEDGPESLGDVGSEAGEVHDPPEE